MRYKLGFFSKQKKWVIIIGSNRLAVRIIGNGRRWRESEGADREGHQFNSGACGPTPPQGHQIGRPIFRFGAPTRRSNPNGSHETRPLPGPHFTILSYYFLITYI